MINEKQMNISVGIVAYNEEDYLPELLDDITNQTYPHDKIEIILIDSLSTDRTVEIMNDFKANHSDFKEIVILKNHKKKQAPGWNVAISNFSGDALIRVDAHAKIPCDFVENNVKCLDSGEMVCGGVRPTLIKDKNMWSEVLLLAESSMFGSGIAPYRRTAQKKYVNSLFHGAYRREVFKKSGGFNEFLGRTEDNEFHYRIRQNGYNICMDSDICSYQYARPTLRKMIQQKWGNGYWIGLTCSVVPKCFSLYHFIPMCFVMAIVISLLLMPISKIFIVLLLSLYGLVAIGLTIAVFLKSKKNLLVLILPILFFALHVSYGLGTCYGFLKIPFWRNRKNAIENEEGNNIIIK